MRIGRAPASESLARLPLGGTAAHRALSVPMGLQPRLHHTSARPPALAALQVGGGPTGVELAAELHDLVNEDIARLQPQLRVRRSPCAGGRGVACKEAGAVWGCQRPCTAAVRG